MASGVNQRTKVADWRGIFAFGVVSVLSLFAESAHAVQGWYAAGQVWVVWEVADPAPNTYRIFKADSPVESTDEATEVGRVYPLDWEGVRLRKADSSLTLTVPTAGGGTYTLGPGEGVFAYTPRNSGSSTFAVVTEDATTFAPEDWTGSVTFSFDPVGDPVRPHLQAIIDEGDIDHYIYTHWILGDDDERAGRPDVPVMGNSDKNGTPHVFLVSSRFAPGTQSSVAAANLLHGGGGSYWAWRATSASKAIMGIEPDDGITVAHDDVVMRVRPNGTLAESHTWWFGYTKSYDFFTAPPATPPDDAVVVDYTFRRLNWINDFLVDAWSVDADRVSVIGHSMGGAGTWANARLAPERYASAVAFNPAYRGPVSAQARSMLGAYEQNLATNRVNVNGALVRANDLWTNASTIALTRDYPLIRVYVGRLDVVDASAWGMDLVDWLRDIDATGYGVHSFWDIRTHQVAQWSGRWANQQTGEQTSRDDVVYQARYRADQSFPAFFNDDQNPSMFGRQPDPGLGTPVDGDINGTWAGFFDWELDTIVDTPERWEATVFLVGTSSNNVDNFPGDSAVTDMAVRKPQAFHPAAGDLVNWTASVGGTVTQSGQVSVDGTGVVAIAGLSIPKDPSRMRLLFEAFNPRTELDDSDPAISYKRGWHRKSSAAATNGNYHRRMSGANGTSASPEASFSFNGDRLTIQYGRSSRGGISEVIIDGSLAGNIDFSGGASKSPEFGFEAAFDVAAGHHDVIVRHVNGAAYLDGVIIEQGAPVAGSSDNAPSSTLPVVVTSWTVPVYAESGDWISILIDGPVGGSASLVAPDGTVHHVEGVPVDPLVSVIDITADQSGTYLLEIVDGQGALVDIDVRP